MIAPLHLLRALIEQQDGGTGSLLARAGVNVPALKADIDRAITEANIGLNPQNNGESVMIKIPVLTEERRRDLTKIAKKLAEEGKVAVRNIRADYLKKIKNQGDEVSEDVISQQEKDLQKAVDAESKKIDELLAKKETDIGSRRLLVIQVEIRRPGSPQGFRS